MKYIKITLDALALTLNFNIYSLNLYFYYNAKNINMKLQKLTDRE